MHRRRPARTLFTVAARAASGALAVAVLLACGLASAQPCITCRTEKCPSKANVTDWCGSGKDPLAKPAATGKPAHAAGGKAGRKFQVRVVSTPIGAAIHLDPIAGGPGIDCTSPCKLDVQRGGYRVSARLDGFVPSVREVEIEARAELIFSLEKAAQRSTIEVRAPDGSALGGTIQIDEAPAGVVPREIEVPPGRHVVVVTRPGYEEFRGGVELAEGQRGYLDVALARKAAVGSLLVSADSDGADVVVDGARRDMVPALVAGLVVGAHIVEVRKAGFAPWRQEVQVTADAQTKVMAHLVPLAAAGQPAGAQPPVAAPPVAPPPPVEDEATRKAREAEAARLAAEQRARDAEAAAARERLARAEARERFWKDLLLHPFYFDIQPITIADDYADVTHKVQTLYNLSASVRVVWLVGDLGVANMNVDKNSMDYLAVSSTKAINPVIFFSFGIAPITLGTWTGKEQRNGLTYLEPYFLVRFYDALGESRPLRSMNWVVGNHFLYQGPVVGVGLDVSAEFGSGDEHNFPSPGSTWGINIGLMLRLGPR